MPSTAARRVIVSHVRPGPVALDPGPAHHLRDVLRLKVGDAVEAFDAAGSSAPARIIQADTSAVVLQIDQLRESSTQRRHWTIAAAIPKAQRADWMIEKLSELGTPTFIPLEADRSVVVPQGIQKHARWDRLATEAARQSYRQGVMKIEPMMTVHELLSLVRAEHRIAWYCSTDPLATPIAQLLAKPLPQPLLVLIGPEGGWTEREIVLFNQAGLTAVHLTDTVLRVETAALTAAALIACALIRGESEPGGLSHAQPA